MDLFLREASERIGADDVLAKIAALMDWRAFSPLVKRGLGRSGDGPPGYDPLILFKCLLIGQWHGLSDPKLERALKVRLEFMISCGLDLHAPVPDETTHCRFRNALVKGGVYDDLLVEVCAQIEAHGLKLKKAEAAIIDAPLVESTARPRTHIEAPQDRAEDEASDAPDVHFSADPDARWVKKGSKSTLGYKAFARADEEGFIDKGRATPATRLREEVQQADLQAPLSGRASFRHDETPLRPAPRPLFRAGQNTRPTGDGRKQDHLQPANPCNRVNRNDKISMPAETKAGRARGANQIFSSKSRPRAVVLERQKTSGTHSVAW